MYMHVVILHLQILTTHIAFMNNSLYVAFGMYMGLCAYTLFIQYIWTLVNAVTGFGLVLIDS